MLLDQPPVEHTQLALPDVQPGTSARPASHGKARSAGQQLRWPAPPQGFGMTQMSSVEKRAQEGGPPHCRDVPVPTMTLPLSHAVPLLLNSPQPMQHARSPSPPQAHPGVPSEASTSTVAVTRNLIDSSRVVALPLGSVVPTLAEEDTQRTRTQQRKRCVTDTSVASRPARLSSSGGRKAARAAGA
jgi:hypothetical protein